MYEHRNIEDFLISNINQKLLLNWTQALIPLNEDSIKSLPATTLSLYDSAPSMMQAIRWAIIALLLLFSRVNPPNFVSKRLYIKTKLNYVLFKKIIKNSNYKILDFIRIAKDATLIFIFFHRFAHSMKQMETIDVHSWSSITVFTWIWTLKNKSK